MLAVRIAAVIAIIAAITLICFRAVQVNATTAALAYLVAILFIAARWGLTESIAGSLVAVAFLNYYFLPPIRTFTIADPQNWVALFAFLVTAVVASNLAERARREAERARQRRREVERLYALSQR